MWVFLLVVANRLYIFGGWDGNKRLNDLYVLDTREMVWSVLKPTGCAPQAPTSLAQTCWATGGPCHGK